jgi:hypothetical protein
MVHLQEKPSNLEGDKTFYQSKWATLDRQIDNLVYELYDPSEDEIALVEKAVPK